MRAAARACCTCICAQAAFASSIAEAVEVTSRCSGGLLDAAEGIEDGSEPCPLSAAGGCCLGVLCPGGRSLGAASLAASGGGWLRVRGRDERGPRDPWGLRRTA